MGNHHKVDKSQGFIDEGMTLITETDSDKYLNMAAKPAHRNSASVKYFLRRNLFWFVIGLLVIGWAALTPSGHYWINHFISLL